MKQLERIKILLSSLPQKDQILAEKFIATRSFDSLYELVHSALIITKGRLRKGIPVELNMDHLQTLDTEVSNYLYCIDPDAFKDPDEIDNDDEEY